MNQMTIQQNGGFVSDGDKPKETHPPAPVDFTVTFTCWEKAEGDCDIDNDSIIVKAMSFNDAVDNAIKELKKQHKWSRVIAIFGVTFECDKWGRALTQEGQLQFPPTT